MLATWPDVFYGGAAIAGIPYDCTTNFSQVSSCLNPGRPRAADVWGDSVRGAYPSFQGPWPKMSVWQGSADSVVNPVNATEMVKQWTDVHGTDQVADEETMVDGYPRKVYHDSRGQAVVEEFTITGGGHGTFVDPDAGCGNTGAYLLDNDICAAAHISTFFGLTGGDEPDPGDTTAPTVAITSPSDAATVEGEVVIEATASDDTGVRRVDILVNGTLLEAFNGGPYRATWDTSALANGSYTLRAVAVDEAGNEGAAQVQVTVQGAIEDTTPPTVAFTAPSAGATVSGRVQLTANAADDFGVRQVAFIVDGEVVAEVQAPPFQAVWDATAAAEGEHTLVVQAVDAAGNQADDTIAVTVEAGAVPDTTGPVAQFTSPAPGATVAGLITVKVTATDADGVDQALLFSGEELIGADYREPFEFLWDTSTVPEGPVTLTARVFDTLGNPGIVTLDIVVGREGDPGVDGPTPGEPGSETIRVGKRYWGCGVAPSTPATGGFLVFLLALAGLAMRRRRVAAGVLAAALSLGAAGCQGDDIYIVTDGQGTVDEGDGGEFGSASQLEAYLEGKTMVMEGTAIPTHPNGFNEDINFGQATQCYHRVAISPLAGRWTVTSDLGTLSGAGEVGEVGDCDRATASSQLEFVSTAVLLENVRDNGGCFDVTMTFPGFGQEGRGRISPDGQTITMELFFKDQAVGHRCADGDVGEATVTLDSQPFTGNAMQTYVVFQ